MRIRPERGTTGVNGQAVDARSLPRHCEAGSNDGLESNQPLT